MRCGACGENSANPFYWAGVLSMRCDNCGADLLPGVDLMRDVEQEQYDYEYQNYCESREANKQKEDAE